MKEKRDMWVPLKKKKHNSEKFEQKEMDITRFRKERKVFLIFFSFFFLSQIYGNRIVGIRRANNENCSTQRGLCMGTKNTGFH